MNDNERIRITKNTIEALDSLRSSIEKAGGMADINRLCEMSVLEFISHVCVPNGVRFVNEISVNDNDHKCKYHLQYACRRPNSKGEQKC